jgi:Glyoxalase-like domain
VIRLDHILWAAPDLDEGAKTIERLTGVTPARGGVHPGFGTRNSLIALDPGIYFEIIAPDPAQDLAGNRGGRIAAQARPGLMTFAIASDDLASLSKAALREGLRVDGPVAMHRNTPSGGRLDWTILSLENLRFGESIPFAIDWGKTPHPSASTPLGCRLKSFAVAHPDAGALSRLYTALGIPVAVKGGAYPAFVAELATPNGDVVLTQA